jgi:hypothetical protein
MAGDWLKMDSSTPDKPEVLAITARMGWDDPDLTVGKLFRVWRWFDQQTVDGNAPGVTSALLDRIAGVTGFADAMRLVGWLVVDEGGLSLPKFDRHNGATAKARAQTAKRVASHRGNAEGNADSNATSVTGALAREEKRREDSSSLRSEGARASAAKPAPSPKTVPRPDDIAPQVWADWIAVRAKHKAPLTQTAWDGLKAQAEKAGISVARAVEICAVKGWRGFDASWGWPGKLAAAPPGAAPLNRQEALEERNRAAAAKWAEQMRRDMEVSNATQ